MLRVVLFIAALIGVSAVVISGTGRTAADESVPMPPLFAETLIACDEVAVESHDAETNTVLDLEHHVLMIDLPGSDDPITVDYTDPVCVGHPVIGSIIQEVLDEEREDMRTECESLQEQLARGHVEARGFELDINKVQAHVDRWCAENAIP